MFIVGRKQRRLLYFKHYEAFTDSSRLEQDRTPELD